MPEANEQPTPRPRDFRQEVTDNIVSLLEKGVAPWQKPWDAQSSPAMPVNPTTERAYRGGNAVHLLAVCMQRSYEDPRWMTYKQATEQGWQVRRGEKGTQPQPPRPLDLGRKLQIRRHQICKRGASCRTRQCLPCCRERHSARSSESCRVRRFLDSGAKAGQE